MKIRPFAEQGHFTTVHNLVFRQVMPQISGNAFKVLCFIISETTGYGRRSAGLSYQDIKAGTGIGGETTVSNALGELLDKTKFGCPLILRQEAEMRGRSRKEKTRYAINRNFEITLQKQERKDAPETGASKKVRTPKTGASFTPKTGASSDAPIKTTRSNQRKNKENSSLSAREDEIDSDEIPTGETEPPTENPPFVEGETDDRFETPHFHAVADVCALDLDIILWKDKSFAAMVAAQLATKYTPDQIRLAGERWEMPTPPHPRQLLSRIKALLTEPKSKNLENNPDGTNQKPAAPKYESAAERRGRDLSESLDEFHDRDAALAEQERRLAELESPDGWAGSGSAPPN